jgi:hypothetical protein
MRRHSYGVKGLFLRLGKFPPEEDDFAKTGVF